MTQPDNPLRGDYPDTIAAQAAYWFAVFLDGGETAEERRRFGLWLEEQPAHRDAFLQIENLWSGSSSLKLQRGIAIDRRVFLGGTATAVVAAIGYSAYRSAPTADMWTDTGERRDIALPNGVEAMLASNTSLSHVSQDGVDGIRLHSGEAWFNHIDKTTPFFVAANNGIVWCRGGSFDVSCFGRDVTVITQEGRIAIRLADSMTAVPGGTAVQYRDNNIGSPYAVDLATALAWRDGRLVFMGSPLDTVAKTLERWQTGHIVILGNSLKSRPVTMVVDLDNLNNVLRSLGRVLSVDVIRITDYLTILREA